MPNSIRRRRPWPSSLPGQIIMVAALALLVAQLVNFAFLLQGREHEAEVQAASIGVARIGGTLDALQRGEVDMERLLARQERRAARAESGVNELRQERRDRRRARGMIRGDQLPRMAPLAITDAPFTPDSRTLDSDLTNRATQILTQVDDGLTNIRVDEVHADAMPPELQLGGPPDLKGAEMGRWQAKHQDALLISAQMPDGRTISVSTRVVTHDDNVVVWLIGQTLVLYLAVLLPLAFIAFRMAKPLKTLTRRTQDFALNAEHSAMEEAGPDDMRRLIAAFNHMQERVGTLVGEKDVMLGAIGHDLKTPLASLRLRLETIGVDDEDEGERLRMIDTVGEMGTMLDDILTLARLGRSGEPMAAVDMTAMLSALTDDYADQGKSVRFVGADDGAGYKAGQGVALRPVLVRRALRNLIDNALTYGGEAEVALGGDGGYLLVTITDKGPGIAGEDMERLFEPFRRAEASRNRKTGGSGLGLTIARAIARAHGGDVTLANGTEGGLIATLSLARRAV
jgi:signal transduction histidine kinase